MIFISAGHQKGTGVKANGIDEGETVILIRDELKKLLPRASYLPDDFSFAETLSFMRENAKKDDLAVEIHLNSNSNPTVGGTEAYYSDKTDLADAFALSVSKKLGVSNRGAKNESYSYFGSLGFLHLPCRSVIVEACYLSNWGDVVKLKDGGIRKIALGIYEAIYQIETKQAKISIIKRLIGLCYQVIGLIKKT